MIGTMEKGAKKGDSEGDFFVAEFMGRISSDRSLESKGTCRVRNVMVASIVIVFCSFFAKGTPCAAGDRLIKYSHPEVSLYTDIGKRDAERVIDAIRFFDAYVDGFFRGHGLKPRKKDPIRCRLYARYADFEEYRRKTNAAPYAGAFFSPQTNSVVASFGGGKESALQVLLHECAHVIQERYIPNPIPWFDEGLATYFDGTRFDEYRNVISCCNAGHLKRLRTMIERNRLIPWKKFFEVQRYQLDLDFRQNVLDVHDFYAQSWGVVFYLAQAGEDQTELFKKFIKGMNTGRERSKLLLTHMARSEDEFKDFIGRPGHDWVYKAYDAARKLGKNNKAPDALGGLEKILERDPRHLAALRLAAETAHRCKEYGRSAGYWRRLVELQPQESVYLAQLCRTLAAQAEAEEKDSLFDEAIEEGKAAVRLTRSRDAHALASLAEAYHRAGFYREALATMRKATRFKTTERDAYKRLEKEYAEDLKRFGIRSKKETTGKKP